MKVAVFSAKPYDQTFLAAANVQHGHELHFFEPHLTSQTTVLAAGFFAVCDRGLDDANQVIQDDVFQRLLTFPNVIITGHQAFFTETALKNIAEITLASITDFEEGSACNIRVTFSHNPT